MKKIDPRLPPEYANNNLGSKAIFDARKNYKDNLYPTGSNIFNPLDLWYEKPLYGKVDENNNPVYLSETNLKQLNAKDTLMAADFVVDAYNDLRVYLDRAVLQRRVKREGFISDLEPKSSWISLNELYHTHIDSIYKLFVFMFLKRNRREKQVVSLRSFIMAFTRFSKGLGGTIPITRGSYILSTQCDPKISGLIIDLGSDLYSQDEKKDLDYLKDKDFKFYINATKKFGFRIDKNVPWRIIADISSPQMQTYMEKYGLTKSPGKANDLFESYYYSAHETDVDILKKYMLQFYNSFAAAYPTVENNNSILSRVVESQENVERGFNDAFWISAYFNLRISEDNKQWDKRDVDARIKKALEINKAIDFLSSLLYINNIIKKN